MAYTREEIRFLMDELWGKIPFKDKVRRFFPILLRGIMIGLRKSWPVGILVAIKAARLLGLQGITGLGFAFWWMHVQLLVGWMIGWFLPEVDHLFYAVTCDSKEEACQRVRREIDLKRWKGAWKILEATASEREKMPVHNAVTTFVVGVVGIWIATSSASLSALGMVFALGTRLTIDMWSERNFVRWYWIIKREIGKTEHRIVCLVMSGLMIYQLIGIVKI